MQAPTGVAGRARRAANKTVKTRSNRPDNPGEPTSFFHWHRSCLRPHVPFASVGRGTPMERHLEGIRPMRCQARPGGLIASVASMVLLVIGLSACATDRSANPARSTGALPDQEVSDFAITETDEGHVEWKLYARYAAVYNARNQVQARAVRVDFFGDDGERTSVLTAREGEINQRTRDMTARGDVVLETTSGTRLSSEELSFLNREQRIVVPPTQLVRVERDGDVLTGYGFESDPELRRYEFKKQVRATVRPRPGALPGTGDETP